LFSSNSLTTGTTMSSERARILLLSDTHLGFDQPRRPRVHRRRRGPDFFQNYDRALAPARDGAFDMVVHGGDLLFRSKVSASLVHQAMAPLFAVADAGVPVFIVPGNHERSRIPYPLLTYHPNVFIFDRPRTFVGDWPGFPIALSGFPFIRNLDRRGFHQALCDTQAFSSDVDARLLCIHQAVEGAQVGVQNFTFRPGLDVIRGRDIPSGFAAILSGHIHRHQLLTADLSGRPLAAPVIYPGSIERTAFDERLEPKGTVRLHITPGRDRGGILAHWSFQELPARPMAVIELHVTGRDAVSLQVEIRSRLASQPVDSVVQLRLEGELAPGAAECLRAASMRDLTPSRMNLSVVIPRTVARSHVATSV